MINRMYEPIARESRPAPPRPPRPPYREQGELVDRIEHHVTQTTDYVETGRTELIQASKWMARARKVNKGNLPAMQYYR